MHFVSSALRMTVDHQLLVNAVMPREQLEVIQAKICYCAKLVHWTVTNKTSKFRSDGREPSHCFPFDMGNTLHNQQKNILLSLRGRSQTSACLKKSERQEKRKS